MIELGQKAKDKITGFEGIVVSKHTYIDACSQYGLQPESKDSSTLPDIKYFDEGRLFCRPTNKKEVKEFIEMARKKHGRTCDEKYKVIKHHIFSITELEKDINNMHRQGYALEKLKKASGGMIGIYSKKS